jgi:hypothetical protein
VFSYSLSSNTINHFKVVLERERGLIFLINNQHTLFDCVLSWEREFCTIISPFSLNPFYSFNFESLCIQFNSYYLSIHLWILTSIHQHQLIDWLIYLNISVVSFNINLFIQKLFNLNVKQTHISLIQIYTTLLMWLSILQEESWHKSIEWTECECVKHQTYSQHNRMINRLLRDDFSLYCFCWKGCNCQLTNSFFFFE